MEKFTVQVKINLWLDKAVRAESMEDALEKAKSWTALDVVDFDPTKANDHEIEVTGVFK